MDRSEKMITRYCVPGKLDFAEYGAICKVQDGDNQSLFIQLSADEEKPYWMPVGNFLEKTLAEFLGNGKFLHECLRIYKHQEYNPLQKIMDIIHKT
jgi:hypothetical protein